MQNQLHIFAVRLMKTGLEASRVNLLYKYDKLFTMTINWSSEEPFRYAAQIRKMYTLGGVEVGWGGGDKNEM